MPVNNDGFSMAMQPAAQPVAATADDDSGSDLNTQTSIEKNEGQILPEPVVSTETPERPVSSEDDDPGDRTFGREDDLTDKIPGEEGDVVRPDPVEGADEEDDEDDGDDEESLKDPEIESTGGGWYKITWPDGSTDKVQGRESAYEMAGIRDPEAGGDE